MFTNFVMFSTLFAIISGILSCGVLHENGDKKCLRYSYFLIGIMIAYVVNTGLLYDKPTTVGLFVAVEIILFTTALYYIVLTIFSSIMLYINKYNKLKYVFIINIVISIISIFSAFFLYSKFWG